MFRIIEICIKGNFLLTLAKARNFKFLSWGGPNMSIFKAKKLGLILLVMVFVISVTACEMSGTDDIIDGIDDDFPTYTDDYMGLEDGVQSTIAGEREWVYYDENGDIYWEDSETYTTQSRVDREEDIIGKEEFLVRVIEEGETLGGSIYHKEIGPEIELKYFLAGVVDETGGKDYFTERIKVLDGKIEKGDEITLPVKPLVEEYTSEIEVKPISLVALEKEIVEVGAGVFTAWRLEGQQDDWIVEDEVVVDIVEINSWFVPYLGTVKRETEMEVDFLDPDSPIDRGISTDTYEMVDYSIE